MEKIRILHAASAISQSSASYRLHMALRQNSVDSWFFTKNAAVDRQNVIVHGGKIDELLEPFKKIPEYVMRRFLFNHAYGGCFSFNITPSRIYKNINDLNFEIINLHWICNFIPISSIAKLNSQIVWTLHDKWPFTAGCHILKNCDKFISGCKKCPQLNLCDFFDMSYFLFYLKCLAYRKKTMHIVAPSKNIYDLALSSSLFENFKIYHIPNAIDTSKFFPYSQQEARKLLGLPLHKKIILFGAVSAMSDLNKGADILFDALSIVRESMRENVEFVIFGSSQGHDSALPTRYLGNLLDSLSTNLAYNAADVFVCPSREENLPNTVLESLSCGTPVVCFDIGGNADMVLHMKSGYLAAPYDVKDLAYGIQYVLSSDDSMQMSELASRTVKIGFAQDLVAKRYIELYSSILCDSVRKS